MQQPKLLVLGSTNLDTTMLLDNFVVEGESKICKTIYETCGGKGANQAVACAKLGATVQFISAVGDDPIGNKIIENLKELKINCEMINKTKKVGTGKAFIMLNKKRSNCLISYLGANEYLSMKNNDLLKETIKSNDGLITQLETNLEPIYEAIKIAKQNKKPLFLNPAPANQNFDLTKIKDVDFFIPNQIEIDAFTKCGYKTNEEIKNGAKRILAYGAKTVIVTLGDQGALLVTKNKTKYFPAIKVKAIDTVGAGDCFVASFAYKYLTSNNVSLAIDFAIKASAYSVTFKGAQASYGTLKQIEEFQFNTKK